MQHGSSRLPTCLDDGMLHDIFGGELGKVAHALIFTLQLPSLPLASIEGGGSSMLRGEASSCHDRA